MQHLVSNLVVAIKMTAFWLFVATPSLAGSGQALWAAMPAEVSLRGPIHLPPSNPRRGRAAGNFYSTPPDAGKVR